MVHDGGDFVVGADFEEGGTVLLILADVDGMHVIVDPQFFQ